MVGNSLSNDSGCFTPSKCPAFFSNDEIVLDVDGNIIGSASLTSQQISGSGGWPTEMDDHDWRAVTFQPSFGTGVTIGTEHDAIVAMVAALAPGTTPDLYLYEGWPGQTLTAGNYQTFWDSPVVDADSTAYVQKRAAVDHLLDRARADVDANFHVIPTGAVLREIDVRAKASQLAGLATVYGIYRDDVHMGDVGKFAAGVTVYTVLQGKKLIDTERWRLYASGNEGAVLTQTLAQQIIDLVWDVVSTDPRTGVTP